MQQGEVWKCFVPVPIFAAGPSYPLEIPSFPFGYSLGYSSHSLSHVFVLCQGNLLLHI